MQKYNARLWIMSALIVGLLMLISESFYSLVSNACSSGVVYPALRLQQWISAPLYRWYHQRKSYHQLYHEHQALQAELEDTRAQLICTQSVLDYTQQIQEQVDFKQQQQGMTGPIVQILMKQCTSQGHFFWIDAGSSRGIVKDMVAVYKQNLIGKVVEVYPWYSKVQLITDSACKVACYCAATNIHGIHKGCNTERNTVVTYVSHLDTVHPGDMVLSSGEGLVFPKGLALGRIVATKQDGLYQHVEVKTEVDLSRLEYCMIIDKAHKSL